MTRTLLVAVPALFVAAPAAAHDLFLLPAVHADEAPREIELRLLVGDHFAPEEERGFRGSTLARFELVTARGRRDLSQGDDGPPPFARVEVGAGGQLFAIDRRPILTELEAERFDAYLEHEGLSHILAARRAPGASGPGRERYTRYLKSFVQIGARRDGAFRRVLGQRLELVPLDDPSSLREGANLRVRLLFEGRPLADQPVTAYRRNGDDVATTVVRTDPRGEAVFTIDRAGTWLLRTVHMRACERCEDADWESFWGALTFGVCASSGTCAAIAMLPSGTSRVVAR
jgi:hypothetical protein